MMFRISARSTMPAALLASALVCGAACSTRVKPYECPALVQGTDADAQQLWDCNREIIVRIVKGKRFTIREFEGAAAFFESVTGIPARAMNTGFGRLPGQEIKHDLRKWDAWLEGHRIHWDPAPGRVTADEDGSA